ncbi:F-box domain containing protein [Tanacetum coccineum]|uniref:F-box domain containing protein n=1 Tax=Tanacetum coccineum TaxID=301880 RepID=A0ABQ5HC92_9ASTR
MRAMVLWTINDFPARSSLSGWSGQGYKACPTCNEETPSIGVKNKIAYVGHRRFLRKHHKWRSLHGVRYVVQSRDERRTTQNSSICAPGLDGEMGVIVVENETDIIHLDNSSDLPPSTSGNDSDNVTFYIYLHIDGESTEVDAPPDIIDVPGEDDDISDDEDPLPHDLADSDVEDLINDDDGVEKMADVARAHGGDGGGEDPSRPPPTSFGCAGCFINRGKGKRKPNLGGVKAGRKTRERTRNQVLKDAVAANKGRPIEIGFEDRADNTVVPTGPYSTQWGNYFGEMIRSIPLYYPSWQKVPAGDKARLMATLGSTYNLEPHMRSERWPRIEGYIQAQFGKSYNTNKATLKREHWIRDPETGAYDLDRIRRGKPDEYTDDEWEKYINFWNDPANAQRAETNRLNRSKSTVVSRHGSRSIPLTRHLMKMTSATQEEPSEIDTFYRLHTVNGVFQDPEALRMYDRMRELEATGEHTTAEINAMVRGGKLRGHIPGVGPVMPGYVRSRLSYTAPVDRSRDVDFMMSLMRSDNRFADAFARYDSGGASGSGGSRARDREDGDDTGGEDGGDDTNINECEDPRTYPCYGDCINTQGSYNCTCFRGTTGDAKTQNGCQPVAAKDARWKILIIGITCLLLKGLKGHMVISRPGILVHQTLVPISALAG